MMVPRLFRILPRSTGRWNFFFSFARQHYRPTMILLSLSIRVFFIFVRRRSYTYYASFIYLEDAGRPQAPPLPPSLPLSVFFFIIWSASFFFFFIIIIITWRPVCALAIRAGTHTHTCCPLMGGNEALLLDPLIGGRKNNGGGRKEARRPQWHRLQSVSRSATTKEMKIVRALFRHGDAQSTKKNFNREKEWGHSNGWQRR